ncbi:hypothetical protein GCM10009122_22790 [Fulvivirga kasyanovii]|uniref:DUF7192 domain-containing protein n=1 Tax=Fulvivirga kasyanovii TaxID=396812 RepID=A0ABW9RQT7_9BACT|nr:hypothetical protein [Fulvivirga kasyanovii]MTI26301.1 hypothetical protein [Fulvivirga kasyanovii]
MLNPRKHTVSSAGDKYNYLLFDCAGDFHDFVDHQTRELSPANKARWKETNVYTRERLEKGSTWYGDPPPADLNELNAHDTFSGLHLVKQIKPKIKAYLYKYLNHLEAEEMPKPRIAYNDRGIGVFSFDRAAMNLQRLEKVSLSTPLDKTASQLNIELGRTKIITTVKKAYAWFEHRESSLPAIRLYLVAGANADIEGNNILYTGLGCCELAEFMELRGVPVEVNILIETSFQAQTVVACVRVKRFQDKVDLNQLLLISSDPKYYRYRGFKALIAMANYFDLFIPEGLGSTLPDIGKGFVNALGTKGFVFEQSYSLEAAAREVKQIIDIYNLTRKNGKG